MFDDFVANPRELRRQALGLGYSGAGKDGNYPGINSDHALPIAGLDDFVGKAIGEPVRAAPGTLHGHCRLTLKRDKGLSGVHIDPAFYSGILYLSLPEHAGGGTDFFRHRRTGLDRIPGTPESLLAGNYTAIDDAVADVVNKDTLKSAAWERSFTAAMRFNRLILFSPWLFHNSRPGFGASPETGRLAYLMFFERG